MKNHSLGKNLFIGFHMIIPQNDRLLHGMVIPPDIIDVLKTVD